MPKKSYKRRADGRYRVKYKEKYFYSTPWGPLSEAIQQMEQYKRDLALGLKEETLGICFADYAVEWVETYKTRCSRTTYNAYAAIVNDAIDQIGSMRMKEITQTDIQKLFNRLDGKGSSSIKKYCMTINSIFLTAVNDGVILRNPCFSAIRPKGETGTHRAITDDERNLIHASVGYHDMAPAAMIMLYAGLRRGEVIAFDSRRCVDWETKRINISEAASFFKNQPIIGTPKTAAGIRSLPIFAPLLPILKDINGYALTRENGDVMSLSAFERKWESYIYYMETQLNGCPKRWYGKKKEHKKILAEGGKLPPWKEFNVRPHDLRHSFATMLYDADVDIKTAVKWMGHSDEKMIMQIYAHLTKEREKRSETSVADHVENFISGSKWGAERAEDRKNVSE